MKNENFLIAIIENISEQIGSRRTWHQKFNFVKKIWTKDISYIFDPKI